MSAIELRGIDHVVLRVRDLDAALRFYSSVLGCAIERRVDDIGLIQLRAGTNLIDLVPLASPLGRAGGAGPGNEGRNVDHFALSVAHFDETALRAPLVAHGVEPGDVAARYGGEEFAVILNQTGEAEARRIAFRTLEHLHQIQIPTALEPLKISGSGGLVCVARDSEMYEAADVLRAADTALYEAKSAGRDRLVCGPVLRARPKG